MLFNAAYALCIALSLTDVVVSRAVAAPASTCSGENCEIRTYEDGKTVTTRQSIPGVLWKDDLTPDDSTESDVRRSNIAREFIPIKGPSKGPKEGGGGDGEGAPDPAGGADPVPAAGKDGTPLNECPGSGGGLIFAKRGNCVPNPGNKGDSGGPGPAAPGQKAPPRDYFAEAKKTGPGGNRAQVELDRRIKTTEADKTTPDIATFNKAYRVKGYRNKNLNGGDERETFPSLLQAAKIDTKPEGVLFQVKSLAQKDPYLEVFHESAWSSDGKVVYADYSFAEQDATTTGRLSWSQLMKHLQSERLPGDDMTQKLEAIGRVHIVNEDTLNTINSIFKALPPKNKQDFVLLKADAKPGSDEAIAFDAFMRSDNAKGVNWMLSDYHNEFGNKVVVELYIRQKTIEGFPSAEVLMVLGKRK